VVTKKETVRHGELAVTGAITCRVREGCRHQAAVCSDYRRLGAATSAER
jgi:hypothetical protein